MAQLGLEGAGLAGGGEAQITAGDALLRVWRQGGVVVAVYVIEVEAAAGEDVIPAVGLEKRLFHLLVQASQFQNAVAGLGGIVEGVEGAGEAFVVGDHQFDAELEVALADGFEVLASGCVGWIVGVAIELGSGKGGVLGWWRGIVIGGLGWGSHGWLMSDQCLQISMPAPIRKWDPPGRRAAFSPPHFGVHFRNLSPGEPLDEPLAFELFERLGENPKRPSAPDQLGDGGPELEWSESSEV